MQPYKNISYEKHSHDVPATPPHPAPAQAPETPFCGREGEEGGAPKLPKNAAAPGPLQGRPGRGGRTRMLPQRIR